MADAKIWKFRGRVTKLIFPVYIVNMSFLPEKYCFSEILVKFEFSQIKIH